MECPANRIFNFNFFPVRTISNILELITKNPSGLHMINWKPWSIVSHRLTAVTENSTFRHFFLREKFENWMFLAIWSFVFSSSTHSSKIGLKRAQIYSPLYNSRTQSSVCFQRENDNRAISAVVWTFLVLFLFL